MTLPTFYSFIESSTLPLQFILGQLFGGVCYPHVAPSLQWVFWCGIPCFGLHSAHWDCAGAYCICTNREVLLFGAREASPSSRFLLGYWKVHPSPDHLLHFLRHFFSGVGDICNILSSCSPACELLGLLMGNSPAATPFYLWSR